MPKGEYHTPGPFHLTSPSFIHRQGVAHPVLITAAQFDEAEKDELVGLLNKGTHFDALADALRDVSMLLARRSPITFSPERLALEHDALKKAEDALGAADALPPDNTALTEHGDAGQTD